MERIHERQVRSFRLHRMGLAGEGHPDALSAARANLFIQAQIEGPALFGLCQRTTGRPSQQALRVELFERRSLVRTWGPRDTVHVFDPARWPLVVAARSEWGKSARAQIELDASLVPPAGERVRGLGRTFSRSDLQDLVPDSWIEAFDNPYFPTRDDRWRFATGRMIWALANDGEVCHATKVGAEQEYAPRAHWFPQIDMVGAPAPGPAATALARSWLGVYGPGTVQDLAHFFGAKVSSARGWVAAMRGLVPVECEGRDLLAREEDLDALREDRELPTRLLPGYDNLLMGHADKSWTIRAAGEEKAVWRKSAVVAAVVLHEGSVVATWTHAVKGKRVLVQVQPLSGWSDELLPAVQAEAEVLAHHLARVLGDVTVEGS